MAKPILIVYTRKNINKDKILEELRNATQDEYHVFLVLKDDSQDFKLEVLNSDNLQPIDIEMLRMKLEQTEL